MRYFILFLFQIILLGSCACSRVRIDLLIMNATLFDTRTGTTRSGMDVSISGNRIQDPAKRRIADTRHRSRPGTQSSPRSWSAVDHDRHKGSLRGAGRRGACPLPRIEGRKTPCPPPESGTCACRWGRRPRLVIAEVLKAAHRCADYARGPF